MPQSQENRESSVTRVPDLTAPYPVRLYKSCSNFRITRFISSICNASLQPELYSKVSEHITLGQVLCKCDCDRVSANADANVRLDWEYLHWECTTYSLQCPGICCGRWCRAARPP